MKILPLTGFLLTYPKLEIPEGASPSALRKRQNAQASLKACIYLIMDAQLNIKNGALAATVY